ncbi:hypothetical protein ACFWIJ_18375 [Streptomyces sp. NPDC127079]|uniref:hypothetical protein n=1 Tax=Streptomyces sp. NPDC127079 TaxID=3347132 RepID=UPI0036537FCB
MALHVTAVPTGAEIMRTLVRGGRGRVTGLGVTQVLLWLDGRRTTDGDQVTAQSRSWPAIRVTRSIWEAASRTRATAAMCG